MAALAVVFPGAETNAATKPSLEPFAGSYTGTVRSRTPAGALFGNATLTFTGRKNRLRGTFLYAGILNSAGVAKAVVQVFTVSNTGLVKGRVTVDGVEGKGSGSLSLRSRTLKTAITYALRDEQGTTIALDGQIVFKARRAKWTAKVASSDAGFNGSLIINGKR